MNIHRLFCFPPFVNQAINRSVIFTMMQSRFIITVLLSILTVRTALAQISCPENLPFTLQGDTSYCVGTPGSELNVPETYDAYEWLPTTQLGQDVLLAAGDYQLVVTHYTGCTDTLDFEVEQVSNPPQPVVTADGPLQFCAGESVTLSGPEGYPYYEWSSGSVSRNITVYETSTFLISIEDWLGCVSSSNAVQVIVDPLPVAIFSPNLDEFEIQFNNHSVDATSYEWKFGDGNISTDEEPTHTYSTSGYHEMYLVATNNCTSDTAFLELANVAIKEGETLVTEIYPNPTAGLITVALNNSIGEDISISLIDTKGKVIAKAEWLRYSGLEKFQLDFSGISSGIYSLVFIAGSNKHSSRLVIQ